MPISSTKSCSKKEWTLIFDEIKSAVKDSGLGYTCKRSTATRGNILKDIIVDLYNSDAVIADLTDKVANVFYELGVRHALKNKTIILTQRRNDAPFDLSNYASHVYKWRSKKGIENLKKKIQELLIDIEKHPEKPDNPVSDYLEERPVHRVGSKQEMVNVVEYDDEGIPHIVMSPKKLSLANVIGILLYARAAKGMSLAELTKMVASNWKRVKQTTISGTLAQMRELTIKEGKPRNYVYRLSGKGRTAIRRLIATLATGED
jgi:hypothetical protein